MILVLIDILDTASVGMKNAVIKQRNWYSTQHARKHEKHARVLCSQTTLLPYLQSHPAARPSASSSSGITLPYSAGLLIASYVVCNT